MKRLFIFVLPFLLLMGSHLYANEADDILYPGNLLSINLYGNKVISKEYRIDAKGYITLPEAGTVKCSNNTLTDCKEKIINKLSSIYKNAASLTITKKSDDMYISILGLVKTPGLYLISPDTSFQLAIQKAGGLSDGAQMNKVQLRRGDKITEVNFRRFLDDGDEKALPRLKAMDEIFVPSSSLISNVNISSTSQGKGDSKNAWLETSPDKSVRIFGGISKPGRYPWSDDMSLLDLIAEAGGASRDADTNNISIITPQTANLKSRVIKFSLSQFIESGGNVKLLPPIKAGYTINIPEVRESMSNDKISWIKQDPKTVLYVFGEVRKPGRYTFDNKLNFLDILSAADGPTDKADLHDVHLIDRQGVYPQVVHVNLSLYFETGDPELLPPILSGDAIYVPQFNNESTEIKSKHVVKILGEVAKPGRYRYTSQMTILDLLSAAGGPTSQAWVKKILVVNVGPNLETKTSVFDLIKFSRSGDLRLLPTIREGDVIYVPNNQEDDKRRFAELLQNLANIALIISSSRTI